MRALLFPGQGSQRRGMGGDLFEDYVELTEMASEILGYSIRRLCLEDPGNKLSLTQFTQPALFVVNAFSWLKLLREGNAEPDFVAGHSLGEYNALLAAGVFDFESGLRLVKARGELMSRPQEGAMAVVLGISADETATVLERNDLTSLDIANFNSPTQTVISGPKQDIAAAQTAFTDAGTRCVMLEVSAAFHSRYMEQSAKEFELVLAGHAYQDPAVTVISNVDARPYDRFSVVRKLRDQLSVSVRWSDCMRFLFEQGATNFQEVGPGDVLTRLVEANRRTFGRKE